MREKRVITWAVSLVALALVLNLPGPVSRFIKSKVRDAVAPIQAAGARAARALREGARAVRGADGLVADNRRLEAEVARLQDDVRRLQTLAEDNAALRRQLGFRDAAAGRLLAAEVIGRHHDRWWQTVRINQGAGEGVRTNLAVVAAEGLVGRTIETSAHTADVLLLSDPSCLVSVRVGASGAFGLVSGRAPSPAGRAVCALEFVNKDRPVATGDTVVTSGLGGVFPAGLVVGRITALDTDAAGLCRQAELEPAADVGALRQVFVVLAAGEAPR